MLPAQKFTRFDRSGSFGMGGFSIKSELSSFELGIFQRHGGGAAIEELDDLNQLSETSLEWLSKCSPSLLLRLVEICEGGSKKEQVSLLPIVALDNLASLASATYLGAVAFAFDASSLSDSGSQQLLRDCLRGLEDNRFSGRSIVCLTGRCLGPDGQDMSAILDISSEFSDVVFEYQADLSVDTLHLNIENVRPVYTYSLDSLLSLKIRERIFQIISDRPSGNLVLSVDFPSKHRTGVEIVRALGILCLLRKTRFGLEDPNFGQLGSRCVRLRARVDLLGLKLAQVCINYGADDLGHLDYDGRQGTLGQGDSRLPIWSKAMQVIDGHVEPN